MLGLLNAMGSQSILPDYNQDIMVVYANFASEVLRIEGSLDILSEAWLESSQQVENLPTWVPHWRIPLDFVEIGKFQASISVRT